MNTQSKKFTMPSVKKLLMILSMLVCVEILSAQSNFNYEGVELADSIQKQLLFDNALDWITWLKKNNEKVVLTDQDIAIGKLQGHAEFALYKEAGILKKLSGKVSYSFMLEVKEGKYRYSINQLVFHYYHEDRNYAMVATGKTKPLTDAQASGWQKLWSSHRNTTDKKMMFNLANLKTAMLNKHQTTVVKATAQTTEW
jgi:hypothetical protein